MYNDETTRHRPGPGERRESRILEGLLLAGKIQEAIAEARRLKAERERRTAEWEARNGPRPINGR